MMKDLISELKEKLKGKNAKIVFPEGEDKRILEAAIKLQEEGIIKPLVLGDLESIKNTGKENNLDIKSLEIIDPKENISEDMVNSLVKRRKGKLNKEEAEKLLQDPNYFGTMLVYMGKADGMVSGAVHTTGETVRPALQIIKTKEGFNRTSGSFIMLRNDEMYLFADCAINIDLDENALAEVAVVSNLTAKQFGMDPKVAMLSFSTKGSAKDEKVDKVANATKLAKEMDKDILIDGELQFDAAFVESVAKQKAPGSPVAGHANVFIFPSLEAGNIGYKIAQRFGGFVAIGPILQGLNKPVNDLSRGCNAQEVESLAIITAAQAYL
ncbi:phosphate acetyltransferase [Peptoniphilus koenoeneniae]